VTEPPTESGWSTRPGKPGVVVLLTGDWIARDATGATPAAIDQILGAAGKGPITFDAGELGHWDSALLVFVTALRHASRDRGIIIDETGLPQAVPRLLALSADATPVEAGSEAEETLVDLTGDAAIGVWDESLAVVTLSGDMVLRGGAALRGRARMRGSDLLTCLYDAGIAALPIVTIVNVLVGGILAFVGSVQLRKFGADIFIAALVGIAVIREMAALMTAIVMSGRTGGAYAAQIATMLANEEIDALRAIGIPVFDYLVLPRIIALTVMMPVLYLYGCAVGIFGGFVVAVAMLNLSPESFIEQTRLAVPGDQVIFGLVKSITFGALIAIAGCRCGLRAGRGAADVGLATTSAVVAGIVGVIALDAIFAVCANALDF
jgi:phospholipid/cholesterol/gamma-HCH transport system permease protein